MWITNPSELFSSLDIFPFDADTPSETFNKLSRLLILASLIVWWKYPEYLEKVVLYGFLSILVIYAIQNNPSPRQKKKEKFSPLTYKMDAHVLPVSNPSEGIAPQQPSVQQPQTLYRMTENGFVPIDSPTMDHPASIQPKQVSHQPPQEVPHQVSHQPPQEVPHQVSQQSPQEVPHQVPREIPVEQPSIKSLIEPMSIPKQSTLISDLTGQSVVYVSKELLPQQDRVTPIQHISRQPTVSELQRSMSKPLTTSLSKAMSRVEEEQDWLRPPQKFYTPNVGVNTRMYQAPILAPRMMDTDFSDIQTNQPVNFNPLQDMGMRDERKAYAPKKNHSLLLEKTEEDDVSECVPSSKFLQGNNKFYMQDIQPNVYSFTYDPTPINSNIGITYAPQNPPLQKMKMCSPDGQSTVPVFTRIDPQLIRDDVPEQRREELPRRGPWSEKYGDFEASTSVDGVTSIYDPRFTGYGDEYRSYQDVNLGNVKYYYTDVDAYRSPNFVVRNKVDHVDMRQPMGDVYSSYPREASLEDVRDIVNNDWMAKSMEHREDIMAQQMAKSNRRNWQMRYAPRSRGSNLSTFTSGY